MWWNLSSVTAAAPLAIIIAGALGYLLGSIPFGLVFTRLAGLGDIRQIGSGNIGATNVLRTGNKFLAALTLIGDMLKGTFAVLLANQFWGPDAALVAGLAAFLGHLFPVWLRFRGGKGVATYIGVAFGIFPLAALVFCVVWLATAIVSRYSSLAALAASVLTPIFVWTQGRVVFAALFCVMTILLFVMHRGNISRLTTGTESRINFRR